MKTIIVPTDFSAAADAAVAYAASVATVTGSTILLVHVYQMPVTMNDFPVLMVSVDDLKTAADTGLKRAMVVAQKKFPLVQFEAESRLGYAGEELDAIASERETLCIATGTQKLSGFENFLLGNDALSLMKNSLHPVIAVTEGTIAASPKNIVLAVDNAHHDKMPVQKISSFVNALKANLHIVHVETDDEESPASTQGLMELFAPMSITYRAVKSTDVTDGIKNYLLESNADLLMLLPHKHKLFERLFSKGHTAEIVSEISLPVVCICE